MKVGKLRFLFATLVTAAVFVGVVSGCQRPGSRGAGVQQASTVYDAILKRGSIRCGYLTYPPYCMKDPNTGKLSGIFVETIEEVGSKLGLKVEWTEEVGYGTMIEGLTAGRYDVLGAGIWPNSSRGKVADFSIPVFYSAVNAYVRPNDNRFTSNLQAVNSPSVKIATIDGEQSDVIAKQDFPKAATVSLPQASDIAQNLLNVAQGKADITFSEAGGVQLFLKTNPGRLKNITPERPVRVFGNTYVYKKGEYKLKTMMDTALEELLNSGYVDKILDRYEPAPGVYYRVAQPYRTPSAAASSRERVQ